MKGKITKRAVDALKPGPSDIFLWDTELKGFGVKCTPAGRKVYLLQFRLGGRNAPTVRSTIGTHGSPWTPEKARKEAERQRGLIAAGIDPREEEAEAKRDALTVAQLCDQYVEDAPKIVLPKKGRPKKASTLNIDKSNIERHIKPLLGKKKVRALTRADIEQFQQDVADGKTAYDERDGPQPEGAPKRRGRVIVKGGRGTAARATAVLASILSYAVRRGVLRENPASRVPRFQPEARERFLSAAELARLGEALSAAEAEGESKVALDAIRALILTGCRKSEILGLRWANLDVERGCLRLPDSKTGSKSVPLGATALHLLASQPKREKNPFVFPGDREGGHFVGLRKAWLRVRARAGLEDVRLHDLRHSFASVAVAGGDSLYLVGKVLGHTQARTTERYAHLQNDPLRAVADRTAGAIATAMASRPAHVAPPQSRR